jgi:hypothetical protein
MEPHLLVSLADARLLCHNLFGALRDYAAAIKCVKSLQTRFRGKLARRVAAALRERARREALVKQYRDEIAAKRATDAHATWTAEKEAEKLAWAKYVLAAHTRSGRPLARGSNSRVALWLGCRYNRDMEIWNRVQGIEAARYATVRMPWRSIVVDDADPTANYGAGTGCVRGHPTLRPHVCFGEAM